MMMMTGKAMIVGLAFCVSLTHHALAAPTCSTKILVECGKGVPQKVCDILKAASPEAFSGVSICSALRSPPQITISYSATGATMRVPLTPEVAGVFGLADTEYRAVKGGNAAFNSQDFDGTKSKAAMAKNDFKAARQFRPFKMFFNTLRGDFIGFVGLLSYHGAGYHDEKGDDNRVAGVRKQLDPFIKSVRIVLDANETRFESFPLSLSRQIDKNDLEAITVGGKTTKRDAASFPADFEKAKRQALGGEAGAGTVNGPAKK